MLAALACQMVVGVTGPSFLPLYNRLRQLSGAQLCNRGCCLREEDFQTEWEQFWGADSATWGIAWD